MKPVILTLTATVALLLIHSSTAVTDPCALVRCAGSKDPCKFYQCNPNTGACELVNSPDTTLCDDGNNCTVKDQCKEGTCVGVPKCPKADKNPCIGSCDPATGDCVSSLLSGIVCDDGLNCTEKDICKEGKCIGVPKTCPRPAQCLSIACVEPSGNCVTSAFGPSTKCDDGNSCTSNDVCIDGVCKGVPKICPASKKQCSFKICNPLTGKCDLEQVRPNGFPCDDGNKCTIKDACIDGVCTGVPKICPANDKKCRFKICNPLTGECDLVKVRPNGFPCDDGSKCTSNDTCIDGVCKGIPKMCPANDKLCSFKICNPLTGECDLEKIRPNGFPCDDGNKCTIKDQCIKGVCVGIPKCKSKPCHKVKCDPAVGDCIYVPLTGVPCNDGKACTIKDQCVKGQCVGTPKPCPNKNKCIRKKCVEPSGNCITIYLNGLACNDGDKCTKGDTCKDGKCIGIPKCPKPANTCQFYKCNPLIGICFLASRPNGYPCNDGNPLNNPDFCKSGICV